MRLNKGFQALSISVLISGMLLFASACQGASAQDIQGLLQAVQGKEMVVTLDDGTTVRITVQDAQAAADAQALIGHQINAKVQNKNGEQQLEAVDKRAEVEDQKATGTIQSIDANSATIGGQTFKITATTELDGGLVAGANARVEFVKLADGTLLATQIETDKAVQKGRGTIDSINGDTIVIGGQSFHVDNTTQKDALKAGDKAHIEFVDANGVKHVTEAEKQVEDTTANGTVQAMTADSITINGKVFKINAATRLDAGVTVGTAVRLEFITMANGDLVATQIENDQAEVEIQNEVEHPPEIEVGGGGGGGGGGTGK